MSTGVARSSEASARGLIGMPVVQLGLFAATLLLSALLLFSIQPVFAKLVLPKLGGSPSVWAVSMCFFQAVLLCGYCYAHLLNRWMPGRFAPLVHLGLCAAAWMALPFGLPNLGDPPTGDAYFWLIGVLALGVGLPFFAVSANAPLLQAWFARTGHRDAHDPYFLYGASNFGSLLALLSYPFLIEPAFGLGDQTMLWTGGFMALAAMIALCGLMSVTAREGAAANSAALGQRAEVQPTLADRLGWIGLSFVPSGLLVAFTTFVSTDIASAPLLWVLPLAVFLLTFMLVFCERPPIPHRFMLALQPAAVLLTMLGLVWAGRIGLAIGVLAGSIAFFVTTMVCHRELFERRPASANLTEFYLWMSLGGVLGGVFAAMLAPQMFNSVLEMPILLVAGMACRPGVLAALRNEGERRRGIVLAGAGTVIVIGGAVLLKSPLFAGVAAVSASAGIVIALLCAGLYLKRDVAGVLLPLSVVGLIAFALLPSPQTNGYSERSFFGVHRVTTTPTGDARLLLHGTTVHGAERLKEADGRPVKAPVPATYYHPASPMAAGVAVARRHAAEGRPFRAGVVGLGTGSLACYAKPGDAWRFYEIDPVVAKIARDPAHFRFLSHCQPNADIVMGDARLTLAKEPAQRFDYLVIDAFSSDAVPVHLLTREAILLYLEKVGPAGLVALHISNRHLDLKAAASALVASIPEARATLVSSGADGLKKFEAPSDVLFISRSTATIKDAAATSGARPLPPAKIRAWTDDRSDILSVLWR